MTSFQNILQSMAVSLGIGLLIGLEREWAHKDVGLRTFALAALAGNIAWLIGPIAAYLALGAAIPLIAILNIACGICSDPCSRVCRNGSREVLSPLKRRAGRRGIRRGFE